MPKGSYHDQHLNHYQVKVTGAQKELKILKILKLTSFICNYMYITVQDFFTFLHKIELQRQRKEFVCVTYVCIVEFH